MTPREVAERDRLLRALPRARQGLLLEGPARQETARSRRTRSASRSTAARSTRRSPRCTCCEAQGDAIGALALVMRRQPDVPRHRPPHLQRLHEGLHLPEAGAGQHPADRDRRPDRRARSCRGASRSTACSRAGTRSTSRRPYALPYNGKNVLVVGLGPGRLHAGALPAQRGLRRRRHRRPEDRAAARRARRRRRRHAAAADPRLRARSTRELDERVLDGFGGVSEYGITVRWDKNFLDAAPPDARAAATASASTAASASAARCTIEDAWELGFDHVAIAAGAGRPTIIDMKNNLIRGIRKAQRLPDGAAAHRRLQARRAARTCRCGCPAVVIGGGLTAIDTATELMAYYPVQVEKIARRATRRSSAELGEARVRALYDAEELEVARRVPRRTAARCAPSARAPRRRASAPNFMPLVDAWGGVTLVYRKRHERLARLPPEPRGGDQGARGGHPLRREPDADRGACPTSTAR